MGGACARHFLHGLMFATRAKTLTGMSSKSRSTLLPLVAATALSALPDSKADALMALAALEVRTHRCKQVANRNGRGFRV